ncbi:MAG: arsenic resistance protein, partial [Dehalococcoidia bacterium]
ALLAGAGLGLVAPDAAGWLERLVWPSLALLLYATFAQVRPADALAAFRHRRFLMASIVANFLVVPGIVWSLGWLLPPDPAVRLGVFLVLLVPCTDWFIAFTRMGRGDTRLAIAVVPLQLLVQFATLPLFLWLFMGQEFVNAVSAGPFLQAFLGLIVLPFGLAALTRHWANRYPNRRKTNEASGDSAPRNRPWGARWLHITASLPVPLLAFTLFLIAASQVTALGEVAPSLGWAALVFVLYLAVAMPLARIIAAAFRLTPPAGRTLAFNLGTRNSFVMLPLALALPAGWEATVAVVVLQSLVELVGVIAYVWLVPKRLFPTGAGT